MGFIEDFFITLQTYNETVLPITVLTCILGLTAVYSISRRSSQASRFVSSVLGFLWLWSGIVFFIFFYGPIDVEFLGITIAGVWYFSGILFIIQSLLFIVYGIVNNTLLFSLEISPYSIVGAMFVIYSMVIYPLIGYLTGYAYPKYPVFGSSPCPAAIFTVGLLFWTNKKVPLPIVIIPFIWGIMGIMPVLMLSIYADIGLILSGIIGFPLILLSNRSIRK